MNELPLIEVEEIPGINVRRDLSGQPVSYTTIVRGTIQTVYVPLTRPLSLHDDWLQDLPAFLQPQAE